MCASHTIKHQKHVILLVTLLHFLPVGTGSVNRDVCQNDGISHCFSANVPILIKKMPFLFYYVILDKAHSLL